VDEMTGFQAKCNVMKKLAIFVLLRVEEESKIVDNVIEQIVHHNTSLDGTR
jgi:hypothetical protein